MKFCALIDDPTSDPPIVDPLADHSIERSFERTQNERTIQAGLTVKDDFHGLINAVD